MWKTASVLVAIVLILVTLGIVMLASTSAAQAEKQFKDKGFFLKRQAVALSVGFVFAVLASRVDYRRWRTLAVPVALLCVGLLAAVFVPGIGITLKGSTRWINAGIMSFQPSDIAKLGLIFLLAWWMSRVQRRVDSFGRGFLVPICMLGTFCVLILAEPDFGTTMLLAAVGMAIMFVGGARVGYLVVSAVAGMSALSILIMRNPVRMRRILAFLDPEKHAQAEAYQLLNAIYAFVVGGPMGVGLGNSLQKRFYLPEAHTDFIYAIIGEELGLWASFGVILLFVGFFVCGLSISIRARDMFGRLTAFGITAMITLQAAFNIGVVTGCLPTKGLPLPFISYGGTSLAVSLMMVGVLVNIALQATGEYDDDVIPAVRDRAHRF